MAYALSALQRVAAAQESSAGTLVAPTRLVPHLAGTTFTEQEERQRLEEPRGVLAWVDDVLTRRGTTLELQQELDWDHCLLALLCGVQQVNGVADTTTRAAPYTYAMSLGPTTLATRATASWEVLQSDGSADHILRRFAHARPTELSLEWQDGGTTRLSSTWMGGAASTPGGGRATIAASTLASRSVVPAALWTVALNDSWAALGDTVATNVRALSWSLTTGLQPSYHLRGRANYDLDGWYQGRVEGSLSLTLDLDAAAAAEVAHWRDGDLRFVRLRADNGESAGDHRRLTIDQTVRIIGSPDLLAADGEQATLALECELRSAAAGAADDILAIELLAGIASWAG